MNVLMVHRQSPSADVIITCERCVTAWRTSIGVAGLTHLGLTISKALDHVCDPDRADVTPVAYDHQRGSTTGHDG